MNVSGRGILLIVAIVIAAFTVISIRSQMAQVPENAPAAVVRVVLAKRDLAPGTFVQGEQDLEFGLPPQDTAPLPPVVNAAAVEGEPGAPAANAVATTPAKHEPYLLEGSVKLSDFNGAVVRRALHAGLPVPQQALMRSGEGGFMSAVLEPGMRAVSIAVNATTGNAGFVSPGDRVDLIVTHRFKTGGVTNTGEESVVSETFAHDLRVVAVDQMLDNPENKAILAKTVTMECTPREAEEIAVAGEMGKISLALRSLSPAVKKDVSEQAPAPVVAKGEPVAAETDAAPVPAEAAKPNPIKDLYGQQDQTSGTRDSDLSRLLERRALLVPRVQVLHGDKSETIDFQGAP